MQEDGFHDSAMAKLDAMLNTAMQYSEFITSQMATYQAQLAESNEQARIARLHRPHMNVCIEYDLQASRSTSVVLHICVFPVRLSTPCLHHHAAQQRLQAEVALQYCPAWTSGVARGAVRLRESEHHPVIRSVPSIPNFSSWLRTFDGVKLWPSDLGKPF